MDRDTIRKKMLGALAMIAPESAEEQIDDRTLLQDQLDLDSVDILNYVLQLQKTFQLEIQSSEYRKFMTLEQGLAQLQKMMDKTIPT